MALDTRVRGNEESGAEGVELLLRKKKKKNIRRKAHQRYECREVRVKWVGHVQTEEEEGILGNMMLKRGGRSINVAPQESEAFFLQTRVL